MNKDIKFPCGYEVKTEQSFFDALFGQIITQGELCPLHGSKCKREAQKQWVVMIAIRNKI